jgi:hypothetical protein
LDKKAGVSLKKEAGYLGMLWHKKERVELKAETRLKDISTHSGHLFFYRMVFFLLKEKLHC